MEPPGLPNYSSGYPSQQNQQTDQFGYYGDPSQFQQQQSMQQSDQFSYYGDPNQFQQQQNVQQDPYASPNGNM